MAERQLEWQWGRVRRPEPRALEEALLPHPRRRAAPEAEQQWRPLCAPEPPPAPPIPRGARKAPPRPDPRAAPESLKEGLADLERFIREVGGDRIGPVRASGTTITVGLRAGDGELYHLRIATRSYPIQPPSCTFVDAGGKSTGTAWPDFDPSGPFRPPEFICTPPTAEFYRYHRERQYDPQEGTLVNTVCTIFTALNSAGYSGRYPGGELSRHERARRMRRRMRGE